MDLLRYTPRWLQAVYPFLYRQLVGHLPSCWALGYRLLDLAWLHPLYQPWRRCWNLLVARRFLAWVETVQPDLMVATHFFSADVLAAIKRRGRCAARLIVVITDLYPHRMWLVGEPDAIVVGSEGTRTLCQHRGVPPDRLHVLGIPISARFSGRADREATAARLGLDPTRRTLLVASGGMGVGPMGRMVDRLLRLPALRDQPTQLLVVCGQNASLVARLQRLSRGAPFPVHIFGFVDHMDELMNVSDLFVTKPGGLTVMEALAVGLPMVFYGAIPGQEQLNADYVVHRGAAVEAKRLEEALQMVPQLLNDPGRLKTMRAQAQALGTPMAASRFVQEFIGSAPHGER